MGTVSRLHHGSGDEPAARARRHRGVLYQGAESPTYEQEPPLIVGAVIKDLAGGAAGLQIGDRIVTVAGREMRTWISSSSRSVPERDRETEIVVDRGGRRETITVTPEPKTSHEVGEIGVLPKTRLQLGGGHAAHGRGSCQLRRGDVIAALDGKSDPEQQALIAHIKSNPNKPLRFSIVRDGQPMDVTVTPEGDPDRRSSASASALTNSTIQPGFPKRFGSASSRTGNGQGSSSGRLPACLRARRRCGS